MQSNLPVCPGCNQVLPNNGICPRCQTHNIGHLQKQEHEKNRRELIKKIVETTPNFGNIDPLVPKTEAKVITMNFLKGGT